MRKKSSKDKWQKRWFEANDHYLTYYKSETSDNLLACIDLRLVGDIRLSTDPEHISEFVIQLGDRNYRMKAKTAEEAERWVKGLLARKDGDSSAEEAANGSGNDKNKLLAAGGKADPKDYGVNDANGSAKLDGSGKVVKAKELEVRFCLLTLITTQWPALLPTLVFASSTNCHTFDMATWRDSLTNAPPDPFCFYLTSVCHLHVWLLDNSKMQRLAVARAVLDAASCKLDE